MRSETYKQLTEEILEIEKTGKSIRRFRIMKEQAWIKTQGKCEKCPATDNLTLDHIIPKTMLLDMGFEPDGQDFDEENFSCLCRRCNMFKSNRLDFSNPKTKKLLLKYINQIN